MTLGQGPSISSDKIKVILTRGVITVQQTTPDAEGQFSFIGLTEGDYEVTIEAPGYRPDKHFAAMRYPGHEEEQYSVRLIPLQATTKSEMPAKSYPEKAVKFFDRGLRSSRAGKHEEAATFYAKAVSISPDYVEAWNNLGGEYRILKRWDDSEQALNRALTLDPKAANSNLNLALLFLAQGKAGPARKNLDEAIGKDPDLPAAHYLLGVISYDNRQFDLALGEFRRCLELDPKAEPAARVYAGSILAYQGKFAEAKQQLEDFLKDYPTHPKADEAKQLLQKIQNFRPKR